jgi:ParB-like chromosome segregation protein Spo0J
MASGVKLADNVVQDIARLVQAGEKSGRKIAKALGLSKSTVQPYMKQLRAGAGGKNGQGDARHVDAEPTPSPATPASSLVPVEHALEPHPLAALFPLMAENEFSAVKADIAAHGLREPIWLYEGKILDGRNRHRACRELGLECQTRDYVGPDPLSFILSMNLHRRHLSESQRAMVAERIANLPEGRRANNSANLQSFSQAQAAELLNVSTRSVAAAHKVRTEAQPEVIHAVEAGTLAVSAAAKIADRPVGEQRAVVRELASGAAKSVDAALKHVTAATGGKAPAPAPRLTPEMAAWEKRLAAAQQYFAKIEQSKFVEGLGHIYADEAVGGWLQALEQLSTVTRQLAERLQKAFQER